MNRNHVFDSNGPDMRLRGTAQQLVEKYLQLGRDATGAGDRVMAESYLPARRALFPHPERHEPSAGRRRSTRQALPERPIREGRRMGDQPEPTTATANGQRHGPHATATRTATRRSRTRRRRAAGGKPRAG
jgi:hypothetical protein